MSGCGYHPFVFVGGGGEYHPTPPKPFPLKTFKIFSRARSLKKHFRREFKWGRVEGVGVVWLTNVSGGKTEILVKLPRKTNLVRLEVERCPDSHTFSVIHEIPR
jgi:hypothetical protein